MTNLEPESQPTEVAEAPVIDGSGEGTQAPVTDDAPAPPPPEPEYLEIDDALAAKHVKVKVDGEELSVPLNEALQGYQRQEAFTRKTQEAAQLRQEAENALRLQQALQTSPGMTVQILAQQAGVSVEEFLGMTPAQQQQAVSEPQEDQYVDPLERALNEERQARLALQERVEQREADEYLQQQIQGLKQTYQIDDEQVREVVGQALQMGVGPEAFPMIYQAQAFQKLQAQQGAQQDLAAKTQQEEQQRQAAAQAASQVVSAGTGATNVTTAPSANGITSPRDAVLAAFDSLDARR